MGLVTHPVMECEEDLKEKGIPSMIYYSKPMHRQAAFAGMRFDEDEFPACNQLCDTVLSLPIHPYITEEEQARVIEVVLGGRRK